MPNAAFIALIALMMALCACGVGYAAWRWLEGCPRRHVARCSPCLRHPVVLAHGLFGFDIVDTAAGVRREYFQGISDRLKATGCTVYRPRVAPVASVATRARALADFVLALPHRKVNIIAHSMGGLDARYAIARLGLESRVASLTTIGTPHQGTPLADVGVVLGQRLGVYRILERFGVELEAFHDLTTERAAEFNAAVPDARDVAYASVVGVVHRKKQTHPLLLASWLYLLNAAGANDGVVPANSQLWGDLLAEIDADHWAQIGRSSAFDAATWYEQLVRELRGRGL